MWLSFSQATFFFQLFLKRPFLVDVSLHTLSLRATKKLSCAFKKFSGESIPSKIGCYEAPYLIRPVR